MSGKNCDKTNDEIEELLDGDLEENEIFSKKTVYNKDILKAVHLLARQNRKIVKRLDIANGKVRTHSKLIFGLYGLVGTIFTGLVIFFLTRLV